MSQAAPAHTLAIATCAALPQLNDSDRQLRAALEAAGVSTEICVWNDPQVDFGRFDAMLIRSIWDYFQHHGDYLAWLDRLQALGVRTVNADPVLRWNSDKRYLRELEAVGVRIVPTVFLLGEQLHAHLQQQPVGSEWVVKPAISGGAWHTVRGQVGDLAFVRQLDALPAQLEFLLQAYLPEIATAGEWSLLYFGGQFSHAVLKTPAAGDWRVQVQYGGQTQAAQAPAHVLAAAQQVLDASVGLLGMSPTYARVDGVEIDGAFVLMELELIEPYLFTEHHPQANARLVAAVLAALSAGADSLPQLVSG